MQLSKDMAKEYRREELDFRASLEVATVTLHDDVYNMDKQEEDTRLKMALDEVES